MTHRSPALGIYDVAKSHPQVVMTGLKGLNNSVSDEFIDDQELSAVDNFVIDYENAGVLIKREGITLAHATCVNSSITSVFDGIAGDYATANSAIWSLAGAEVHSGLAAMTDPTWTSYTDGSGNQYDIVSSSKMLPLKTSDGSTFAAINSAVSFLSIAAYNNFLFGIKDNTLRWSAFGDEEVWDASNSLTFDFQPTALTRYKNYLYMFNQNEFFQLDASSAVNVVVVGRNYDEGCSSHRSTVVTPYGLFWWSKNGPVRSDGNEIVNIGKRKIPTTLESLNKDKYSLVHGVWNPSKERVEFWVFNSSSTTVDMKILYYPLQDAFFISTGAGTEMGASGLVMSSGAASVYVGSAASAAYVYTQTGDTDNGTPIEARVTYKRVTPSGVNAVTRMRCQTPMIYAVGDLSMTYGIYLDSDSSVTKSWEIDASAGTGLVLGTGVLGTSALGGAEEAIEFPINRSFRYRKIKPYIADNTALRSRVRGVSLDGNIIRWP